MQAADAPTIQANFEAVRKLNIYSGAAAALSVVFGILVALGWCLDIELLKRPIPDGGSVPVGAALWLAAFGLCAFALGLPEPMPKIARGAGLLAGLAALVKMVEILTESDWSFASLTLESPIPGHMPLSVPGPSSIDTLGLFLLYGLSIATTSTIGWHLKSGWRIYQIIAITAGLISLLPVVGYITGQESLCTVYGCIKMPIATAIASLFVCFALLFRRMDGPLALFASTSTAGLVLRRMLVLVLVVCPFALVFEKVSMSALGFDRGLATSLAVLILVASTVQLVWSAVKTSAEEEKAKELAQSTVAALTEQVQAASAAQVSARVTFACPVCGDQFENMGRCPVHDAELNLVTQDMMSGKSFDGKYEIIEMVGVGGMSSIYRARHSMMDREVAIKIMHSNLLSSQEAVQRFQHESRTISRLNHPNLVAIHDFGVFAGQPYMVLDFLRGRSLAERLRQSGVLPYREFLEMMIPVCEGLSHAHEQGVVHRDIKPSNIMLMADDTGTELPKIVDFGIAKLSELDSSRLTQTGDCLGSPRYMSPEQWEGAETIDRRSDIYSLGCLMYESLVGYTPVPGASALELLRNHCTEPPEPFPDFCEVPAGIKEVIIGCLEKSPDDRPNLGYLKRVFAKALQENSA